MLGSEKKSKPAEKKKNGAGMSQHKTDDPLVNLVSVMDVVSLQEGCQSECRLASSLQEEQCLTILFKGGRKSLDLQCKSRQEAQHWACGIRTLQERIMNISQAQKLNQYPSVALILT
ncbi:1-phosphatidylinositol 4,5-bisphosphate phosphodiesterase delta-3-A-like [Pygocentrus nattereri]|uniref:1-phosphatidylinositol 4,5-bisphosphate phosphodiesterase delta-3-A-like n=1 Tax=Pygocentrus nattereri TaxID=42514 RepID=UPI0018910EBA|nr:1-phosphatidylinositol 4,5-bisphosphate phosphodiesterase delta-3-A-like [Pygocentrus nattereri]